MKKILSFAFVAILSVLSVNAVNVENEAYYEQFRGKDITLNVFNWGEYISDGSEDSLNVLEEFENISGIRVVYNNYETNEDLYAKLSANKENPQYDIIIPSDYMISRMIREDMVEKINFDNIPNISMIDDKYRYPDFDSTGEYSVPYTWGTVGIIYNSKYVDAEDVGTWDLLWNKKYAGNILMFSNSRDAYGVALKKLGYSLNSTNRDEIEDATEILKLQRSVNQSYVMDQTFDKMENESAYIAPYYAGDCLSMMENNENLAFYYPEEGFNIFIDSICIPKGAKNKEAAEAFINFLCETEIAVANCEYICYFTPHTEAAKIVEFDERIYPTDEQLAKSESFIALPDNVNSLYDSSWIEVRSSLDISEMVTVGIILGLALTVLIVLTVLRHMKKGKINY